MTTPAPPRSSVWDAMLEVVVIGTAAFGAALMLLDDLTRIFFDLVAFPAGGSPVQGPAATYLGFVYGGIGAVMIGWAVALLAIVRGPLRQRQPWAWRAVGGSIGSWYVIDTAFSLWMGYPGNALLNTVLAVGFAVPLLMIRREFTVD